MDQTELDEFTTTNEAETLVVADENNYGSVAAMNQSKSTKSFAQKNRSSLFQFL